MKLQTLGSNQTVLNREDGSSILFSYNTPVACRGPVGCYRTEVKHSKTTERHLNAWYAKGFETRPQSFFDGLINKF